MSDYCKVDDYDELDVDINSTEEEDNDYDELSFDGDIWQRFEQYYN